MSVLCVMQKRDRYKTCPYESQSLNRITEFEPNRRNPVGTDFMSVLVHAEKGQV